MRHQSAEVMRPARFIDRAGGLKDVGKAARWPGRPRTRQRVHVCGLCPAQFGLAQARAAQTRDQRRRLIAGRRRPRPATSGIARQRFRARAIWAGKALGPDRRRDQSVAAKFPGHQRMRGHCTDRRPSAQPPFAPPIDRTSRNDFASLIRHAQIKFLDVRDSRATRRRAVHHHATRFQRCSHNAQTAAPRWCSARPARRSRLRSSLIVFTMPKICSTNCGARPIDGSSSRIVSGATSTHGPSRTSAALRPRYSRPATCAALSDAGNSCRPSQDPRDRAPCRRAVIGPGQQVFFDGQVLKTMTPFHDLNDTLLDRIGRVASCTSTPRYLIDPLVTSPRSDASRSESPSASWSSLRHCRPARQ